MSIYKINLINKKWIIYEGPKTQFICGVYENWMFVESNQVHVICTYDQNTPTKQKINSLKHLIFDDSDSTYTVIGTGR